MALETDLPLDSVEEMADLARLDAELTQCLPAHVCLALASRCRAFDAGALAERVASASCYAAGNVKDSRRQIFKLLAVFDHDVLTTGKIPRPTSNNVKKIHSSIFAHHTSPKTQDRIQEIWEETAYVAETASGGLIADLWQAVHRVRALAAIDERCEIVGLVLLHACFVRVRGSALPWSVVAPLMTEAGSGPGLGHRTVRELLSSCRSELQRLVPACRPHRLQRRLRDQAIRDCHLQRIGPVIDAMFWRPGVARGEVKLLEQVSDRTARRDIHVIQETGWATAESEKGSLRLAIPLTLRLAGDD